MGRRPACPTTPQPTFHCSPLPLTVTPEELADDGEYNDIVEDMREECGKYGRVLAVSGLRWVEQG